MSNRIRIYTKVTPEELAWIREKMSEVDVRNCSAYLLKMGSTATASTWIFPISGSWSHCSAGAAIT